MNYNSNIFIYLLLLIYSIHLFSSDKNYFNKSNINDLCEKLNNFQRKKLELNTLNAYDRAEEKIKLHNEQKKFMESYFIIKLTSNEFQLGDYNFANSYFEIKNIKLNSKVQIELNVPILLNIKKNNAKMIAAKKELGILDLYLKIRLNDLSDFYSNYCTNENKKNKITHIYSTVYEYFFMCAQSGNVIDYELLHEKKDKFISSPFIDLKDIKKKNEIKKILNSFEKNIYNCKKKFNSYGMKIYQININSNGSKQIINKNSSFSNKNLEHCIDKVISEKELPKTNEGYSVFFSVVVSNLK